jgi:transcriptional regulator with GAF, ATPase, and Fis domain
MASLPAKASGEQRRYYQELQLLITDLSTRFAEASLDSLDETINYALSRVGSFVDVDRSYVFTFSKDGKTMSNTHEWCADCMHPQIQKLQGIIVQAGSWWMKRLTELNEICVPDVSSLPQKARRFKEALLEQSVKALIILPIIIGEHLIGFLGFDSVRRERNWKTEEIRLLAVLEELFAAGLSRRITIS